MGRRFTLAFVGLFSAAAGLYAALLVTSRSTPVAHATHWAIAPSAWGRVTITGKEPCRSSSPCRMRIVLGPRTSRSYLYTLQNNWIGAAIALEDQAHTTVSHEVRYAPVATCGLHIQGYGLDAQVMSGLRCVPPAAAPGSSFWLRIANLLPQPRAVVVDYYHR